MGGLIQKDYVEFTLQPNVEVLIASTLGAYYLFEMGNLTLSAIIVTGYNNATPFLGSTYSQLSFRADSTKLYATYKGSSEIKIGVKKIAVRS